MKYKYLIFDVDGTLLNFNTAYSCAQQTVAKSLGIDFSGEFIRIDEELSWKLWDEFGLSHVEDETVQENYHKLYDAYLRKHFASVAQAFGVKANIDTVLQAYYAALASSHEWMEPDTLDIYRALSEQHKMIIATNGIGQIQRSRLQDFLPMTAGLFISEEIGCIKPSKGFFTRILDRVQCIPDECLMIGDSLSTDIAGAKKAGIPTCWYNFKQKPVCGDLPADYCISVIKELISFA